MIALNVPYAEKDEAKALGAKWDYIDKYWYIPKGVPPKKFKRWLPEDAPEFNDGNTIELIEPVYLSESKSDCLNCGKETPVFCLCSSGFEDEDNDPYDDYTSFFVTLSNLKHCGDELKEIIGRHAPEYFKDSSKQAGGGIS